MNLPTEKLYNLGRHKMFKCWKCSSSDPSTQLFRSKNRTGRIK